MQPDLPEPAPITPRIREVINVLFLEADRAEAERLLFEDCGRNLPFCEDYQSEDLDRFRLAALKLSRGRLDKLIEAICLAQTDWRDLLMAADFGHDVKAHLKWKPTRSGA